MEDENESILEKVGSEGEENVPSRVVSVHKLLRQNTASLENRQEAWLGFGSGERATQREREGGAYVGGGF